MVLLSPNSLFWAILVVPVIGLYLWRIRPRRHTVSTGFLWERVFSESGLRSARWSVRHRTSLCVQLAILLLLVFAMAEPLLDCPRRFVLVVDNSAGADAIDVEPSGLDEAKRLARQEIAALGYRDQMAIIAAGHPLRVHCGLTSRHDVLERALEALAPSSGPTRVADAVDMGRRLLAGSPNGVLLNVSERKPAPTPRRFSMALWLFPAGAALLLLVAEWCLFHRRWIC